MFTGVYTALITPFDANGNIDYPSLGALLETQIKAGVDGLVLLGTTAEAATMTAKEKQDLLDFAVSKINGRVKSSLAPAPTTPLPHWKTPAWP